jgi:hypothetical protein
LNLAGSVRSRGRTGPLYGRECDLIEAGLNEAAATALSDEKKFKIKGLRQSSGASGRRERIVAQLVLDVLVLQAA